MQPIDAALCLLLLHAGLGAVDTFVNHEWREHLPRRPGAATELALHSARSLVFALTFLAVAWYEWHGVWAWLPPALVAVEYAITLADSVVEDGNRRLSAFERINHMLLALNTGLYAALLVWQAVGHWQPLPTAVVAVVRHEDLSWALTLCAMGTMLWMLRDGIAARRLTRAGRRLVQARDRTAPASAGAGRSPPNPEDAPHRAASL